MYIGWQTHPSSGLFILFVSEKLIVAILLLPPMTENHDRLGRNTG